MKATKIILISLTALLIIGGIGTFSHFKSKFMSAPPNQLTLSETGKPFSFKWVGQELNGVIEPHAAMLVPVKLPNIDQVFYMQFDMGAPSTVLTYNVAKSINEKFGTLFDIEIVDKTATAKNVKLQVGSVNLKANYLSFRGMGKKIDWSNPPSMIKIGTIGADFMERHTLSIDFANNVINLSDSVSNSSLSQADFSSFTFDGRKVFLAAKLNDEPVSLWFDSGSSSFEFIVDKSAFERFALPNVERNTYLINSWGQQIPAHNAVAEGEFTFGRTAVPLTKVSYFEWPNKLLVWTMKLSNIGGDLGGMTGNKLFLNKTLVLDTPNLRYAVIAEKQALPKTIEVDSE